MKDGKFVVQAYLPAETHGMLREGIPWGSQNAVYEKVFREVARVVAADPRIYQLILTDQFRIEIDDGGC